VHRPQPLLRRGGTNAPAPAACAGVSAGRSPPTIKRGGLPKAGSHRLAPDAAMIRIAISPTAFDAIFATLPVGSVVVEAEAKERGERYVWLEEGSVNRLGAMRGPDESYSDVIMRMIGTEAGRGARGEERVQ
jgi:hypothetical protein